MELQALAMYSCVFLPMVTMLLKGVDIYQYCDRTVDFFSADLAASVALLLTAIVVGIVNCCCLVFLFASGAALRRLRPDEFPRAQRTAHLVFQILVVVLVCGTALFCCVGNWASAVSNDRAAAATSDSAVEELMANSWRMDPFNVCSGGNNRTRIIETFRQHFEAYQTIHRSATVLEVLIGLAWLVFAIALAYGYILCYKMTWDDIRVPDDDEDLEENAEPEPDNANPNAGNQNAATDIVF